jgi:tetratricopeptide (TPR) repeat protein
MAPKGDLPMTAVENDTQDKIRRFEAYIKADPENELIWINLGDLYHQTGRFDEAVACFEKCLTFDQGNMIARGRLANVLISQHRFGEAEEIIRGIVQQTGEDNALLHNLGLTLFYQSRFEDAWKTFRQARERGLKAPANLAYMIYSLHMQNDTKTALDLAPNWLEESPGPETEGYVSLVELDHGDMDAARQRARQVIDQQPDNADANVVLGTWHMEQQEADKAADHFRQVVTSQPDNPRGWQGLGLIQMFQQNFSEAIKTFEKAQTFMPDNSTNHLLIGWAKLAAKDARAAEQSFRNAVNADRNFGEAHGGLATALVFQNRTDEARVEIKKAMGLDAKGFGALFAQSIAMQLKGQGKQATKLLAKVLEQPPLPRSKPLVEHIRHYVRTQTPDSAPVQPKPVALIKHEKDPPQR